MMGLKDCMPFHSLARFLLQTMSRQPANIFAATQVVSLVEVRIKKTMSLLRLLFTGAATLRDGCVPKWTLGTRNFTTTSSSPWPKPNYPNSLITKRQTAS